MIRAVTPSYDYPAQHLVGYELFGCDPIITQQVKDIPDDYERLREWLEKLFRTIYRYDMLFRECRDDAFWEEQTKLMQQYLFGIKFHEEATEPKRPVFFQPSATEV